MATCASIQVVTMSGDPVDVSLEGIEDVGRLRENLASALGVAASSVQILNGGEVLETSTSLSSLGSDVTLSVLTCSPGPSWYPPGKYMYEGKEVLKVIWSMKHNRGYEEHHYSVVFTDGTKKEDSEEGDKRMVPQERLDRIFNDAKRIVADFGFVTHTTQSYCDQPVMAYSFEAVPPEDPDEWEDWSDGYCESGEKRKPKVTPVCEGLAQQADGHNSVSIRTGTKESTPLRNIPNGTRLKLLVHDGEWFAVACGDARTGIVGWVKQRNVSNITAACEPLHLMEKVVCYQADGYPGVAFRPGSRSAKPNVDIPNGTEIPCLMRCDEFVVVEFLDTLGFVKANNTSAASS